MERVRITKPDDADDAGQQGSEAAEGDSSNQVDREKLIRRIRKLLALAFDHRGNNKEAAAALTLAQRLLAKHNLTLDEVYGVHKPATEDDAEAGAMPDDIWEDVPEDDPNLWPHPVDGHQLIKDLRKLVFRRYLVMEPEQEMACALWVPHAHAIEAAQHSPLLTITAASLGAGKTQLLKCCEYVVPEPFATGNATPAAIFREIAQGSTLLADEAETFMDEAKALRGIFNNGHQRGGFVARADGRYSVFGPKAIALNGNLHPTLESRSIIIRMERKLKSEKVARLVKPRPDDAENHFNILRRMCARFRHDNLDALRDADPDIPPELEDRAADNWRPLLAIADLCGWSKTARKAAIYLEGQKLKELPPAVLLFQDLEKLFKTAARLSSQEIIARLVQLEARPWAEFIRGRPLTTTSLAHLLKPFRILPSEIKTAAGRRANGYRAAQFRDAFERYLSK